MANWNEILDEINKGSTHDIIRRKYLKRLNNLTGRNVIAYYSGWLQKPNAPEIAINDNDKNGFMTAISNLDPDKGLDLVLHTPGGDTAATESIIDYLTKTFKDIRAIIPQLAMSGGTMMAFTGNKILMGSQSSLGPIDPQFGGIPAHGIIEEFNTAFEEIKQDQRKALVWQPILQKYSPTLIGECQKSMEWSEAIMKECLKHRMFKGNKNADKKIKQIKEEFINHSVNLSHGRHLSAEKCKKAGLKIINLEDDPKINEAVMAIHHSFIHTLTATPASKIIENHKGTAFIQQVQTLIIPGQR